MPVRVTGIKIEVHGFQQCGLKVATIFRLFRNMQFVTSDFHRCSQTGVRRLTRRGEVTLYVSSAWKASMIDQ